MQLKNPINFLTSSPIFPVLHFTPNKMPAKTLFSLLNHLMKLSILSAKLKQQNAEQDKSLTRVKILSKVLTKLKLTFRSS